MENKLTLEHLAPYLPYYIKFRFNLQDVYEEYPNEIRDKILTCDSVDLCISVGKLILRPLSDLTKDIEYSGERFVPIIELYKNSSEYYNSRNLDYEFIDSWGDKGNILKVYHNRDKDEYTEFVYSNLSFRKDTRFEKGSYNFGMSLPHPIRVDDKIHNIYFLQKLLFKWHFDVFGLIEKGLAVDVNNIDNA